MAVVPRSPGTRGTTSVGVPTGTTTDDVVVLIVTGQINTASTTPTCTTGGTFALAGIVTTGATTGRYTAVLARRATTSESGSYTVAVPSGGTIATAEAVALTGVDPAASPPFYLGGNNTGAAVAGSTGSANTSPAVSGTIVATNDYAILATSTGGVSVTVSSPPASFTEIGATASSVMHEMGGALSSGATGSLSATISTSTTNRTAVLVAFPAASTSVSSDATVTESVTITSSGVVGKIAAATAVAVGVAITASAVVGVGSTATRSVAVGTTATAVVGKSATATVPVGVGVSATASVSGTGLTATATRSVGVTIIATAQVSSGAIYAAPGTYTWTAPTGLTSVLVELVGGGGHGGGDGDLASGEPGGPGGKGGTYVSKTVTVVPGTGYTIVVGDGGTSRGFPGDSSSFDTTTVVASGGNSGFAASTTPVTGVNGTPVGTTITQGGDGAGGTVPDGGDGGDGGVPLGGVGGVHNTFSGLPGTGPGAGGAGGSATHDADAEGSNGAPGIAVLTYSTPLLATATRSAAVTITATAAVTGFSKTATVPVGVGVTATAGVGKVATATVSPSVAITATATTAKTATATRSVGVTITATATASTPLTATAITNVGVGITASATVSTPVPTSGKATLRPPGKLLVRATAPGSTRPAYLNRHGIVAGLSYRQGLPGGPLDASMTLDVLANANVPEVAVGSTVEITRGAGVVWAGRVNTLTKGTPWQIQCSGIGGIATTETALTQGNIDDIVDASIADGLPWTRPATLGSYQWYESSSDGPITTKLDQVLSSTLTLYGKRWTVDNDGVLTTVDEPDGAPTLLVKVNDPSIPVGLANYATRVSVRYNDGSTGFPVETVINADAEAQFGRVSVAIYAPWGQAHTAPEAHAFGQTFLDRNSPRLTVTGGFTIAHRQITTVTGGVVDLPDVAKVVGQVARLQFAVPLYDAQVGSTSTIDMVVGAATYDDDNATLALEPIDSQDTPVQIMLAGATHELAR